MSQTAASFRIQIASSIDEKKLTRLRVWGLCCYLLYLPGSDGTSASKTEVQSEVGYGCSGRGEEVERE
jgi:hypothetical protein